MKLTKIILILVLFWLYAPAVLAKDKQGRISIPVVVDLNGLRNFAERKLPPNPLHGREYGRTCVEPERACTKVPEFRGLKVTMKNRCVEVTPRIDCTITERIDRQNALQVSGTGGTITVRQDIVGSGTVRGRGEVGRHIRQTVRAAAEFTVNASPVLNPDWSVSMDTRLSKQWLQRPEFKLFNTFPVTIGSQIDPALDNAMRNFEAELPGLLDQIGLKPKAEALWMSLQDPVSLDMGHGRHAYLYLRPLAVSFHGINMTGSRLNTGLTLLIAPTVETSAIAMDKTGLPNLSILPVEGFDVPLPVHLDFEFLNGLVGRVLPSQLDIEGQSVTIQSATIHSDDTKLIMRLEVEVANGPLAALSGPLEVHATPMLNAGMQQLVLDDIRLTGIDGQTGFLRNAALQIANGFVQDQFEVSLEAEMKQLSDELVKVLNGPLSRELRLSGGGEVLLEEISLTERPDALTTTFRATGNVVVLGFDPFR